MKILSKRTAACLTALCLVISLLFPLTAEASDPLTNHLEDWPAMADIEEGSAVVIDADTGGIVYSLNRDEVLYPASVTKILTCLLTLEKTAMTDTVVMGEEALSVAVAGNSNISPVLGESFTVEQCLYMLMLKSANDVAVQLAIQCAGSVSAFCTMMNERAAAIGCRNTHFTNPSGLPDENHTTTAYDLALIMRECLKNDTFRSLIATTSYTVPATNKTAEARTYENHNRLIMPTGEYHYAPCIGGKTGYTEAAGRTLAAAAQKDGRTLIAVTMAGSSRQDFVDMTALFEYGFQNFSNVIYRAENGAEGNCTLPSGMDTSRITEGETTATPDGSRIELIYDGKMKVGELTAAVPAQSDAEAPLHTGETVDNSEGDGTIAGTAASDGEQKAVKEKRRMRTPVLIALIAAILAIVVMTATLLIIHAENRRREEKRRRAEARKRRAAGTERHRRRPEAGAEGEQ